MGRRKKARRPRMAERAQRALGWREKRARPDHAPVMLPVAHAMEAMPA
jgi:hypothetical protein